LIIPKAWNHYEIIPMVTVITLVPLWHDVFGYNWFSECLSYWSFPDAVLV
jgi:hypothetical protein